MRIRRSAAPDRSSTRCLYCRGELTHGEPASSCGGCGAVYHRDCREALDVCANHNCGANGDWTASLSWGEPVPASRSAGSPRLICCHADEPDEPRRECAACRAVLHADCWERLGGCCAGAAFTTLPPARVAEPPRLLPTRVPARERPRSAWDDVGGCLSLLLLPF